MNRKYILWPGVILVSILMSWACTPSSVVQPKAQEPGEKQARSKDAPPTIATGVTNKQTTPTPKPELLAAQQRIDKAIGFASAMVPSLESQGYYFNPGYNGGRHPHGGRGVTLHRASFSIINPTSKVMVLSAKKIAFLNTHCGAKTADSKPLKTLNVTGDKHSTINDRTISIAPMSKAFLAWHFKGIGVYQSCSKMAYRLTFTTPQKKTVEITLPVRVKRYQPYRPRKN